MKYLFAGAGGVGASYAAIFAENGKDVTLIARGAHLDTMKEKGLTFTDDSGTRVIRNIDFASAEEYLARGEHPDVIFLTVKTYSVPDIAPFLEGAAGPDTVIIPLMNGICTGDLVKKYVKDRKVIDGCTYIVGMRDEPGQVRHVGPMARIVFGSADPAIPRSDLEPILEDLLPMTDHGLTKPVLSDQILADCIRKFSYVSSIAAAGLYYDVPAGPVQQPGEIRDFYTELIREVKELAEKMGVTYDFDLVEKNLDIADHVDPDADTSLQRDVAKGGASELDGQLMEPVRLGEKYGLEMPAHRKVAAKFGLL